MRAILTFEAQRPLLCDAIVDLAVAPEEKKAPLECSKTLYPELQRAFRESISVLEWTFHQDTGAFRKRPVKAEVMQTGIANERGIATS